MLADGPNLLAGQMLGAHVAHVADALWRTVGEPDTDSSEVRGKAAFRAAPPADRPPLGCLQHRLCGDRLDIGNMPLAGTTTTGDWEDHRHFGRIDFLLEWYADRLGEAPLAQTLPERGGEAIAGIGKHAADANARGANTVDLGQIDLRLGAVGAMLIGHAGTFEPGEIARPALGQKQP